MYRTIVHSTRKIRNTGSSMGSSGASSNPVAMVPSPRRKIPSPIPARSHARRNKSPTAVTIAAAFASRQKNSRKRWSSRSMQVIPSSNETK
ncbi:hypothetical protein D3C73_1573320 [compost metagenome]